MVCAKETTRFRSDLAINKCHSMFVSLHSDILVMKGMVVIVHLNNKLAVFSSTNECDVEVISDMVQMIHRVDGIIQAATSDDCATVKLTPTEMAYVQRYLQDYGREIKTVTSQLNASIAMLKDITFDQIANLLRRRMTPQPASASRVATAVTAYCVTIMLSD